MFRITDDPSSGSLVQCLDKNYKSDSIVSVVMDRVGVMAAYCDRSVCVCVCSSLYMSASIYSELHTNRTVTICCHNTDPVHDNGHDRITLVILIQALYKAP